MGVAVAQGQLHAVQKASPIVVQAVQRPGADQRLEQAAVEQPPAGPGGQVEHVGEGPVRAPFLDQGGHRMHADAPNRGERVADRRAVGAVLDREGGAAVIDVRR